MPPASSRRGAQTRSAAPRSGAASSAVQSSSRRAVVARRRRTRSRAAARRSRSTAPSGSTSSRGGDLVAVARRRRPGRPARATQRAVVEHRGQRRRASVGTRPVRICRVRDASAAEPRSPPVVESHRSSVPRRRARRRPRRAAGELARLELGSPRGSTATRARRRRRRRAGASPIAPSPSASAASARRSTASPSPASHERTTPSRSRRGNEIAASGSARSSAVPVSRRRRSRPVRSLGRCSVAGPRARCPRRRSLARAALRAGRRRVPDRAGRSRPTRVTEREAARHVAGPAGARIRARVGGISSSSPTTSVMNPGVSSSAPPTMIIAPSKTSRCGDPPLGERLVEAPPRGAPLGAQQQRAPRMLSSSRSASVGSTPIALPDLDDHVELDDRDDDEER